MGWLETFAFTLVIGAQFLAAIVLISKRRRLYPDSKSAAEPDEVALPSTADRQLG